MIYPCNINCIGITVCTLYSLLISIYNDFIVDTMAFTFLRINRSKKSYCYTLIVNKTLTAIILSSMDKMLTLKVEGRLRRQ